MTAGNIRLLKCFAASAFVAVLTACGNSASQSTSTAAPVLTASALSGKYTFTVSGTNSTDGDYSVAGSFTADGKGAITSAVADYSLGSGIDSNVPLTGTFSVTDGVATLKLTDGAGLQDAYTTVLVASGNGLIAKSDGTGSGTLYGPTTAAFTPAGTYSYTLKGENNGTLAASGNFVAAASGTFSSGSGKYSDGSVSVTYPTVTGFLYPPQANGRGQASIAGGNFSYYATASNSIVLLGLDDRALVYGSASKQ